MLENMGYWQNGLEIEKKVMLPYGDAAWIRVKLGDFDLIPNNFFITAGEKTSRIQFQKY